MHLEETVQVSPQGQITLPPAIREILRGDAVRFVVDDDVVRIESLPELGGSLKQYADKYVPLDLIRERIWAEDGDD